jgi:type II secretory pathway pseudopilin PulG
MSRTTSSERGFTLAGLLIILTVMSVFIAYTVPRQWSIAVKRDRERQTIFAMRQYARAIMEWQKRHGGLPTSLDQLKEARAPRLVRGPNAELVDPLTGKVDWILVPPQAVQTGAPVAGGGVARSPWLTDTSGQYTHTTPGGGGTATSTTGTTSATDTTGTANPNTPTGAAASPRDYKGPFVGVRPAATGASYLALNGAEKYEEWIYTVQDLQNEINARNMSMTIASQWK